MADVRYPPRRSVSQSPTARSSSVSQRTATPQGYPSTEGEDEEPRPGWRARFGEMWTTRQMAEFQPRETEVRVTLREMIIYIIFLIIVLFVGLGMISSTMFYYTKVMTDLLVEKEFILNDRSVSFKTATQMADFWGFAEFVVLDAIYWDFWYNSQNLQPGSPTTPEDKKILYQNKLLGVPRLRQVRVRKNSCAISENFRRSFTSCYDFYSDAAEDKESFGLKKEPSWTYSTEEKLHGSNHWGALATYGGGGFYYDFLPERNSSLEGIMELKQNLWIDRGTRAVFLDFTTYNANINLFCVCKLVMEFPPTGGVVTSWSLRTVKLIRYVTIFDFFILACEYMFLLFTIYYTIEEIREVVYFKMAYFRSLWNYMDVTILVLSYVCIAFNIYRHVVVHAQLQDLIDQDSTYDDFTEISFWQVQFNNAVAVIVFFCWIKLFKYISFNRTMAQLNNTLSRCAYDVCGFAVMFFIVFCAFAQLGYLLFGTQVVGFSTFTNSVFTLLRTILGDFDYQSIEEANRVLGPIFFLSYIFFVFFVLLNMFLAIINDTYSEVKSEISVRRNEFEMADFLWRGYDNLLRKCGINRPEKDKGDSPTYEDIRNLLRRCNFSDLEIEMFFAKYDIDKNKPLTEEETKRMLGELEGKNEGGGAGGGPGVSPADFSMLENRVGEMEKSIGMVIDKVDLMIKKLEDKKNR